MQPAIFPSFEISFFGTSPIHSVLSEGQTGQRADNGEHCDSHLCGSLFEFRVKQLPRYSIISDRFTGQLIEHRRMIDDST
jgi:hypothetical protein